MYHPYSIRNDTIVYLFLSLVLQIDYCQGILFFPSNKLKRKHLLSSTMLQIFYRIYPGFFLRVSLFVLYMHSTYTHVFKHETMYSNFSVVFCSRTMRVKKLYGLVEKKRDRVSSLRWNPIVFYDLFLCWCCWFYYYNYCCCSSCCFLVYM